MDFMNLDSCNLSEAVWPLTSESGQFNAFILGTQGNDENVTISQSTRYSQAAFQSPEPWECQDLETYSGWQEEPMDLEVFAQSVDTWRLATEFDESSSIASPSESAPTPIYPSSPIGLHLGQVQFTAEKFEEPITGVVDDSAEPFDSFVLSPSQFQPLDSIVAAPAADAPQEDVAPVQSCQDDDEALALLDELLQGVMEKDDPPVDMFAELMEELENEAVKPEPEQAVVINLVMDDASDQQIYSVPTEELNTSESDAEWQPEPAKRRKMLSTGRGGSRAQKKDEVAQSSGRTPVRQRKKDLPVEDRRLRKKEQNKTAATRYRQKKKVELEILLDEEASLAIRNKELKRKYEDLSKEVSYLKNLMREVLLAQKSKS